MMSTESLILNFNPLTAKFWPDFEKLFGPHGACAGCWCMYWKLLNKAFHASAYEGNKAGLRAMVESGVIPGLIAYSGNEAVGWIAVEPRDNYRRLVHSKILKPYDDQPVWSVTCFFIKRDYRSKGLSVSLLKAACEYVKKQGGRIVEGYPIESKNRKIPSVSAYTGLTTAFLKAGFTEVGRNSEKRPIFRKTVWDK
jgi:GNAT superfamily N-acetyltransferase